MNHYPQNKQLNMIQRLPVEEEYNKPACNLRKPVRDRQTGPRRVKNPGEPHGFDEGGGRLGASGTFDQATSSNAQLTGVWDYVVMTNGDILVGRKHSWLSGGADVLAAGEIKFDNVGGGNILDINNLSGHYVPTPGHAMNFLRIFESQGVNVNNAVLSMYNSAGTFFRQVFTNSNYRILYK